MTITLSPAARHPETLEPIVAVVTVGLPIFDERVVEPKEAAL
jgi:hypothetical protein